MLILGLLLAVATLIATNPKSPRALRLWFEVKKFERAIAPHLYDLFKAAIIRPLEPRGKELNALEEKNWVLGLYCKFWGRIRLAVSPCDQRTVRFWLRNRMLRSGCWSFQFYRLFPMVWVACCSFDFEIFWVHLPWWCKVQWNATHQRMSEEKKHLFGLITSSKLLSENNKFKLWITASHMAPARERSLGAVLGLS